MKRLCTEYLGLVCLLCVTACGGSAPPGAGVAPRVPAPGSSRPASTTLGLKDCQHGAGEVEAALGRADGGALGRWLPRLVRTYHDLRRQPGVAPAVVASCRALLVKTLRGHAVTWHREGQRTKDRHALEMARLFYGKYVEAFPRAADIYDTTFYYAELLYKLQQWEEAAQAYARVVKLDPKGKHAQTASYAGMISCKHLLNLQDEMRAQAPQKRRRRRKRNNTSPIKIPSAHLRFLAAVETHLKLALGAAQRVPLLYRQARIYYKFNHYDQAVKVFAVIVTKHSDHELAEYAGNLLLDSLNIQRKYTELNQWVVVMLKEPKLAKGEFLRQLQKLRRGAERMAAEQFQKAGRYNACAHKYMQIANSHPKDPRAPEVLYNAALCFEAAKQLQKSILVRKRLIKGYPKSRLAPKALYMVAQSHDVLKQPGKAAAAYESFASQFPGEKEAFDALHWALSLRLKRGEHKKALADLKMMQRNYGARRKYSSRVIAAIYSVGRVYEERGDYAAAIRYYETFLKKWAARGSTAWRVLALEKIGRAHWQHSCPVKAVNGSCLRPVATKRSVLTRCGQRLRIVQRRKALVKKAKSFLYRARAYHRGALLRPSSSTDPHTMRLRQAVNLAAAWAAFFEAEVHHEPLLGLSLPKAGRRLEQSLKRVDKLVAKARAAYLEVIPMRQGEPALATLGRLTQIQGALARALCMVNHPRATAEKQKADLSRKVCGEKAKELKLQNSAYARWCRR